MTDMYETGTISKERKLHFDALCLSPIPVPRYTSDRIQALRKRLDLTQAVLAASVLSISISTVRQWEIGAKRPSGPSLKLLDILDRKGLEAIL